MFYECYNKIGERIGTARTKREAEEMIRYANWLLDQEKGTLEYEQRVERARKNQEKETKAMIIGLVIAGSILLFGIIMCS